MSPTSESDSVSDLSTFSATPFPMSWYVATVSQPVRPSAANRSPIIARFLSTLSFMSITVLPLIGETIMAYPVMSPLNTKWHRSTNTSVSSATTRTLAAPTEATCWMINVSAFSCVMVMSSLLDTYLGWSEWEQDHCQWSPVYHSTCPLVYQFCQDQINQLLLVAAHGKNNFLRRKFGCWTQGIHSTGSLISVIVGGLFDTAFLVSVEQQVDITWIQMTLDVSTEVVEEVLHSFTCRSWHDPQYCTSIQEWGINFCMSPFHFYFQSILKNSFRLRYLHGSTIIKHWCRSGG